MNQYTVKNMVTRTPRGLTISDTLTPAETEVLLALMQAGGFATPAGALRCGLWRLAVHLGIEVPRDAFPTNRR